MEQEEGVRAKVTVPSRVVQPAKPPKPPKPKKEVKQLVRTIGVIDTPESQSVHRVNAELAALLNQGWTFNTVHPIGSSQGGSVVVYYLLIK